MKPNNSNDDDGAFLFFRDLILLSFSMFILLYTFSMVFVGFYVQSWYYTIDEKESTTEKKKDVKNEAKDEAKERSELDETKHCTFLRGTFHEEEKERSLPDRPRETLPPSPPPPPSEEKTEPQSKPFTIRGPNVTSITYHVSTPPKSHVSLFSSLHYQSIHRKLVLDVKHMVLRIYNPTTNKTDDKLHEPHKVIYKEKWSREIPIMDIINVNALESCLMELMVESDVDSKSTTPQAKKSENPLLWPDEEFIPECTPTIEPHDTIAMASVGRSPMWNDPERSTKKTEILEYAFTSISKSASFQYLILSLQMGGSVIQNMYSALELVNKSAFRFIAEQQQQRPDEDDSAKARLLPSGVALDDLRRCLYDIPPLRSSIDQIYSTHYKDSSNSNESEGLIASAAEDDDPIRSKYQNKRLVLGILDFFKLFLNPPTKPSSTPTYSQRSEHQSRLEHQLKFRTLVSEAALYVRSYVRAMQIGYSDWQSSSSSSSSLERRLRFDDNVENILEDIPSKNVYYEAIVGNDVDCDVHSLQHLKTNGSSQESRYQGYALVGLKVYKIGTKERLNANKDPVQSVPSLRRLVEKYVDGDFLVCGFFPEKLKVGIIGVWVRMLPRGVDVPFDTIVDTYTKGDTKIRNRKLEVFMQLGPGPGLSPLAWAAMKVMSSLLRWTRRGEAQIPSKSCSSANDRTAFPGMTVSTYTSTRHFSGKNYVSFTSHIDGDSISNLAVKILYQRLEDGTLPSCTVDFTFVLEGEVEEELPERALGTMRLVHVDPVHLAMELEEEEEVENVRQTMKQNETEQETIEETKQQATEEIANEEQQEAAPAEATRSVSSTAPTMDITTTTATPSKSENISNPQDSTPTKPPPSPLSTEDSNRYTAEIEALVEVLEGVTVPSRRHPRQTTPPTTPPQLTNTTDSDETHHRNEETKEYITKYSTLSQSLSENMQHMLVLSNITSSDLRRYFIASECDLKTAAVRLVESAAWRGITFPIDTRVCRVELQSSQFFQQGEDKDGNAVFYFRNMCLGPWRGDVDATVYAVLYRLEIALHEMTRKDETAKCTVIVCMEKPVEEQTDAENDEKQQIQENSFLAGLTSWMDSSQEYQIHTNYALVHRLVDICSRHYPERLAKAIVVPAKGWTKTLGTWGLRAYVPGAKTRQKVILLNELEDLKQYVDEKELVTIVGGKAPVKKEAYAL